MEALKLRELSEKWLVPREMWTKAHFHEAFNEPHLHVKMQLEMTLQDILHTIAKYRRGLERRKMLPVLKKYISFPIFILSLTHVFLNLYHFPNLTSFRTRYK